MKRLIALMFAAVFAMFAGIEFVLPKDDEFYFNPTTGTGDYFQADIATEEVNYRTLYGQVHGFNWSGAEMCDTTQRQDSREQWNTMPNSQSLYEPVAEGKASTENLAGSDGIRYTINVDEDVNICAPATGTINTSHYACNYGKTMEFVISFSDGNTYTMTIEGAKCWYCCANKAAPDDGRYTATTSDSLKGKSMRAGDILCVGVNGTTVTIVHTGS